MSLLLSILFVFNYPKVIHIIPLGKVSNQHIQTAIATVKDVYGAEVIIDKEVPLLSKYKNNGNYRYSADLILKHFNSNEYKLVLTEQDITTYIKDRNVNWGIFGLGYEPGKVAIVSSFKKTDLKKHKSGTFKNAIMKSNIIRNCE